jgi:5-methylthioadenosine/S-adenosylhomocysteine deaminase
VTTVSILIKDVLLTTGKGTTHVYIEGDRISELGKKRDADKVIDGKGCVAIPGLVNAHTHAAMTLMRGYGDDMALQDWLSDRIWPVEAKLTRDDVYWGTRLGCLEMARTGTTAYADMYFFGPTMADAAHDSGLRAVVCEGFIDLGSESKREANMKATEETLRHVKGMKGGRVQSSVGPHAIYTVSEEGWQWCDGFAKEHGLLVHTHLCETVQEVSECKKVHGVSPVGLLERLGVLERRVLAAHCCHLSSEDIQVMGRRKVAACHNPVSNMKLGTGGVMPWTELSKAGSPPVLGTDGAASNNSLDMFETMKAAALLQKHGGEPTRLPAREALDAATAHGAVALGLPGGRIAEGRAADIALVDLTRVGLQPVHDVVSNLVYAGAGHAVVATICAGRLLMEGGVVPGERDVVEKAAAAAHDLVRRREEAAAGAKT